MKTVAKFKKNKKQNCLLILSFCYVKDEFHFNDCTPGYFFYQNKSLLDIDILKDSDPISLRTQAKS